MEKNTNNKLTKQQSELLKDLYSTNEAKIIETIGLIREKGGSYCIAPIMEVYFSIDSGEIRMAIESLISDLKDSKYADIISDNILKYADNKYISSYLSCLWQSAMRFEKLLSFVELFNNADDKAALEIITIIEQNLCYLDDNQRNDVLKLLKSKVDKMEKGFKYHLAFDLLNSSN